MAIGLLDYFISCPLYFFLYSLSVCLLSHFIPVDPMCKCWDYTYARAPHFHSHTECLFT